MILAANLLAPNLGLFVWMLLTFILLMIVLKRFAWGPITEALDSRETTIQESMDQARLALEEAKAIQADNTTARREAEASAQTLLRSAREDAEKLRGDEVTKTREQIQEMQEQARQEIEREKDSALEALRHQVADLAIDAAERILHENLDADKQKKIVNDFLGTLSQN
jgi:F-type H+-transporting ATPase subunit b